jgi:hypothetical protein
MPSIKREFLIEIGFFFTNFGIPFILRQMTLFRALAEKADLVTTTDRVLLVSFS